MHEKLFPNVFLGRTPQGAPRGPTLFCRPLQKTLKSTVIELEGWFLHVNGSVFHQELNREGPRVPSQGVIILRKNRKYTIQIFNTQNFQKNWILDLTWAWHMIWPFWPLFDHKIRQTQSTWGHTTNFSPIGPVIWHLLGWGLIDPLPTLTGGCGMPTQVGLITRC